MLQIIKRTRTVFDDNVASAERGPNELSEFADRHRDAAGRVIDGARANRRIESRDERVGRPST